MEKNDLVNSKQEMLSFDNFKLTVLADFRIAMLSREVSLLGRKEVLTGKAKFGIFGDGIELPQLVMAKYFKKGDFRAGYYRDQTFMFAAGITNVEQYFAQLYADIENDPFSGGRQMNAHFSTPNIDKDGNWLSLAEMKNITSDIAPTAAQMPRSLGLAFATNCFKSAVNKDSFSHLHNGDEVCFCSIGDASTSEGIFWETINAAGVLQVPIAIFIWDNGYGISVPTLFQTTKGSISKVLKGFEIDEKDKNLHGFKIYTIKGWDYVSLCETIELGIEEIRKTNTPAIFHIEELTQPQGHSTSGSHERYKTKERIQWEKNWDCILKFQEWIIENELATQEQLNEIVNKVKFEVKYAKDNAWNKYQLNFKPIIDKLIEIDANIKYNHPDKVQKILNDLINSKDLNYKFILQSLNKIIQIERQNSQIKAIENFFIHLKKDAKIKYAKHLYFEGKNKDLIHFDAINPTFDIEKKNLNGYEILNTYFNQLFEHNKFVYAFGEDVGKIGDVNQGFAGLQAIYGEDRISDVGIREATIIGQAIGMAYRGLRPIAEIQYLDYLVYALQILCDDVATTHFRTNGIQSCPIIVRTRGHRLEGIWHSGSPLGMIINSLNGIRVCVPRNMVQAIGMYNTVLSGNDPAIIIECLNGYRIKEFLPNNLLDIKIPLGLPEVLIAGTDITIVSYGSTLRIVLEATEKLKENNIFCEVIDVQTLLPFDVNKIILQSLKKTNRILFVDEDVPSGGTAYMFKKVIEEQNGYKYLDAKPQCLSANESRPTYGDDGDYFCKPNEEDIITKILEIIAE